MESASVRLRKLGNGYYLEAKNAENHDTIVYNIKEAIKLY